jgi:hypothetical protein
LFCSDGDHADVKIGEGWASVWVQAVSSWLVMVRLRVAAAGRAVAVPVPMRLGGLRVWLQLLYFWSLIAPLVLPDRDFN